MIYLIELSILSLTVLSKHGGIIMQAYEFDTTTSNGFIDERSEIATALARA